MNDWTASQIREVIGVEIKSERRLRDALRKGDTERLKAAIDGLTEKFEASVAEVDKAANLLFKQNAEHFEKLNHAHEEATRILGTYALLRDFNELKSKVELGLSEIQSRLKTLDESRAGHDQRLRNIEDVQPPVTARLKDLETEGASREERLKLMESAETGRSSLSKDEKDRMARTLQRFQILSVVSALIAVGVGILSYLKSAP